jgi:hypothetical protein
MSLHYDFTGVVGEDTMSGTARLGAATAKHDADSFKHQFGMARWEATRQK